MLRWNQISTFFDVCIGDDFLLFIAALLWYGSGQMGLWLGMESIEIRARD